MKFTTDLEEESFDSQVWAMKNHEILGPWLLVGDLLGMEYVIPSYVGVIITIIIKIPIKQTV